jgi:hypothetical protein
VSLVALCLIRSQVHTEGDLLDYRPYVMQEEEEWRASTRLPYDPFESCAVLKDNRFDCPSCGRPVIARELASSQVVCQRSSPHQAFLSDNGSGYAQSGFVINCNSSPCDFRITRETLAVAKFARDLVLDPNSPSDFFPLKCAVYLPYAILLHPFRPVSANVPQRHPPRSLGQALCKYCERV